MDPQWKKLNVREAVGGPISQGQAGPTRVGMIKWKRKDDQEAYLMNANPERLDRKQIFSLAP